MKRKFSKLLLVLLVVCLCGCMIALVACNDNTPPPQQTNNNEKNASVAFDEVLSKLGGSLDVGKTFGLDLAINVAVDDKGDINKDATYKIALKGNVDAGNDAAENLTDLSISLVKEVGTTRESLFNIAYESIDDNPYFFYNVNGGDYSKVNGVSLVSLISLIDKSGNAEISSIGGMISSLLAGLLFDEKATCINNVYTFDFDLVSTLNKLKSMTGAISAIVDLGLVDVLIGNIFSDVSYESNGETVFVTDMDTLIEYVTRSLNVVGQIVFTFDAKDSFKTVDAKLGYSEENQVKSDFSVSLVKNFFGVTSERIGTFDNIAMSAQERKEAIAENLLNFQLKGAALGMKEGVVNNTYDIEIDSDLDPFVLFDIMKDSSKQNIASVIKKLGYFRFTVDEIKNGAKSNIITIYSKFADGYAVLNVKGYNLVIYKAGLGGVYDFDALIEIVSDMFGANTTETAAESENTEEGGIDIGALLSNVISALSFKNITENGVTIDMVKIHSILCEMLNADFITKMGLEALLNCKESPQINIKLQDAAIGDCDKSMSAENVVNRHREDFSYTGYVKEITSIGIDTVEQYSDNFNALFSPDKKETVFFKANGIDFVGNPVTTNAFVIKVDGFDSTKTGPQQVTFYLGTGADIYNVLGSMMSFEDMTALPLFGAYKLETTITVRPYVADSTITMEALTSKGVTKPISDVRNFVAVPSNSYNSTDVYAKLFGKNDSIAKMTVQNDGFTQSYYFSSADMKIYDASGKDVTADESVFKDDNFQKNGVFTVCFALGKYTWKTEVKTDLIEIVRKDGGTTSNEVVLGENFYTDYKVVETQSDGTKKDLVATGKISGIKDSDFTKNEDGTATLNKDLSLVGKGIKYSFSIVTTNCGKITAYSDEAIITSELQAKNGFSSLYPNQSVNGVLEVTYKGVKYLAHYDAASAKFVLVDENGIEIDADYSIALLWDSDKAEMTFAENGVPNNIPYINDKVGVYSRNAKFTAKLEINGFTYSCSCNYNGVAASNITSKFNTDSLLDGKISKVNYVLYVKDGVEVELEFKYGKQGYGIYEKGTDTLAYEVKVEVIDSKNNPVQLVDGKFASAGTYTVSYTFAFDDGQEQVVSHKVTVTAAA